MSLRTPTAIIRVALINYLSFGRLGRYAQHWWLYDDAVLGIVVNLQVIHEPYIVVNKSVLFLIKYMAL